MSAGLLGGQRCALCGRGLIELATADDSGYVTIARVNLPTGVRRDVCRLCVQACNAFHTNAQPGEPEPEPVEPPRHA